MTRISLIAAIALVGCASTSAPWTVLNARARKTAQAEGMETVSAPIHLTAKGKPAKHQLNVDGGRCYAAALSWAAKRDTVVFMFFVPNGAGQRANTRIAGRRLKLGAPAESVRFCTDNKGIVSLNVAALDDRGRPKIDVALAFALVVASKPEPAAATAARHAQEDRDIAKLKAFLRDKQLKARGAPPPPASPAPASSAPAPTSQPAPAPSAPPLASPTAPPSS